MSLTVPDFSTVNVLTVGDLMLDQYWFGPTSRISPEALERIKQRTDERTFAREYEAQFAADERSVFSLSDLDFMFRGYGDDDDLKIDTARPRR